MGLREEWTFLPAQEYFEQYKQEWDALNQSLDNHLLLSSEFVCPLVRYFSTSSTLLGISKDQNYPGMVLVDPASKVLWRTFQPSQAPMGLILLQNKEFIHQQIQVLLRSLPGYTLGFSVTQQDPDYTSFGKYEKAKTVESLDYIRTSKIAIHGSFDDYWSARGKDLVGNLRRRKRRLDEKGVKFSTVVIRNPENVDAGIEVYGFLEQSGWKNAEGTAVSATNDQGMFYREMLKNFCCRGEGVIYQLLMDGKPIASSLCLERSGMLTLLKTAYDEDHKKLSPSYILLEDVLRRLFQEKHVHVLEFYGRAKEWHEKWGGEVRTMFHLNFYRHEWVRAVRQMLKVGGVK